MIRGAPLAAAVPLQNIRPDGTSNKLGSMTGGTPEEIELGPGYWAVSSPVRYKMQVNDESGQGMGAHPVVRFRKQWRPVYVPPGRTKYLIIDCYYNLVVTQYLINRIG